MYLKFTTTFTVKQCEGSVEGYKKMNLEEKNNRIEEIKEDLIDDVESFDDDVTVEDIEITVLDGDKE